MNQHVWRLPGSFFAEEKDVPSRSRFGPVWGIAALALAATVTGCASGHPAASKPSLTGPALLDAAVKSTATIKSFSGTMSAKISTQGTTMTMSGTMEEQRKPLLGRVTMSSIRAMGQNMGPMSVLMTPQEFYVKMPASVTKGHVKTPWIGMPLSEIKAGGTSMSSLINEANKNPAQETQMLAAAKDTRIVGKGTVGGVPVTEIAGTESVSQALASSKLPASARTAMEQQVEKLGVGQIKFTEWIDAQHNVRKMVMTMTGSTITENMTMTMTGINQPVHVTAPPASQVTKIPASALSGSGM